MTRDVSVTLGDHFEQFVDEQIDSGRYQSASEVVQEALRLLEARHLHLEALRAALIEGEESGTPAPLDVETFLSERQAEWLRRRAALT